MDISVLYLEALVLRVNALHVLIHPFVDTTDVTGISKSKGQKLFE